MAEYRGLPSELIDRIFDALWKSSIPWYITNDQRALVKNCLPVSTDFRHHILSRFCKYVKFSNDDARRVFRLRELISQPPNSRLGGIGRFIKHFSLNFQLLNQKRDVSELRIIRQIVQDSDLAAIVKGLHGDDFGVAEFSLTVECIDADGAFWTDLPAIFRAAFQSLLHSPFLIQLSLKNLVVPENFFRGSFLQDLSIEQVPKLFTADPPRNIQLDLVPVSSSLFPSLVTLRTDYSHEIYPSPLPASMLDKLKILMELPKTTPCPERTWHILGMAASSLTEIHIDHTDEVVGLPENFNLGSVHNLKVFKYSCRSSNHDGYHNIKESTPSILFHLFHVAKPLENLKSIKIEFNLEESSLDDIVLGKFTDHHGWTLLDIDLSNASHFPSLFQFGIDIAITLPYPVKQYASRNCIKKSNDDLKSSFPHVLATESISFCPTTTLLVDWDSYSDPMEV